MGWKIVKPADNGREPDPEFFKLKALAERNWSRWWGLTNDEIQEVLTQRLLKRDYTRTLSLAERSPALAREAKQRIVIENQAQDKYSLVLNPPPGWPENRHRPTPQPYGASWRGAEFLVADWLLFLGESGVEVTAPSADDGLDILTNSYCCQVKNYSSKPVGVTTVRELLGVALHVSRKPLLFTATQLTAAAQIFAEANEIPVVSFNANSADLSALTSPGQLFLSEGRYT
jgi:hypothetical protein